MLDIRIIQFKYENKKITFLENFKYENAKIEYQIG